jgi:methyl-accepting chemotaxis protein
MNNNLSSFTYQLNKKLKSFATNNYMRLVELNDAVNKVAKTVDNAAYEYMSIDNTISAMKSTSNKFLNQVYNFGATSEQVSQFSNKMRGMENKVGQLLKQDQPSDIFYFQFSNVSHALDKIIPSNIASQKPKEPEHEFIQPTKIGPNTYEGNIKDVIDYNMKPMTSKDLLDRDNEFYKENPYAGNSSNPAEFNAEMENRKGANKKSKLTKEASNVRNTQILKAIKKVLYKYNDDQDTSTVHDIEYYINDLPPEAKEKLIEKLTALKGSEDGLLRALLQANEAVKFLDDLEKAINDYEHEEVYDTDLRYDQKSILNDESLDQGMSIRDEDNVDFGLEENI